MTPMQATPGAAQNQTPAAGPLNMLFQKAGIYVYALNYALGDLTRDLKELEAAGLIAGNAQLLAELGYWRCVNIGAGQSFLDLTCRSARASISAAGQTPRVLFVQHANTESAIVPWDPSDPDAATRYAYFTPVLMRELGLDHLPYFGQFQSGCAGFPLLLAGASSLFLSSKESAPALCILGDRKPEKAPLNLFRERILISEHASSFIVGRKRLGYQLLGISFYSTARTAVPLIELVKRAVEMINNLAAELSLDLSTREVLVHFPNIFPEVWKRVTRALRLRDEQRVMIEMSERAHCGSSDTVISLSKLHQGQEGRIHVAVTYGAGLHLAISILEEKGHFRS
jgi:3-oxoacyl-[acyl-carrier-protein] synthase III